MRRHFGHDNHSDAAQRVVTLPNLYRGHFATDGAAGPSTPVLHAPPSGKRDSTAGTVALSRTAPGKPSKAEALLMERAPRRARTTRPCLLSVVLSREVEAV